MGQLGLYLVFVGIVLVMNGACRLTNVNAKSTSFMNVATGVIIVVGSFILLCKAQNVGELVTYQSVTAGFLFGFTYLFIAANYLFDLDWRPFGWFSLCVAIFAVTMAIVSYQAGDLRFVLLWAAWAVLWLEGFLEIVAGFKSLSKIFPYLSIAEGIFAAWIPSMFMILGYW
ncbi:MAG: acid-activated urea channel [Campylobacteraceae bacterium]|nr:acid-activated urea channel [Campylobacteraceae bacterium]